jgi:hypothetical protein
MARKRSGLIALLLMATFLMAAGGATALAATPELVNSEGNELVKKDFTGTSGKSTLETKSGEKVSCTAGTEPGEVTSPTTFNVSVVFTGCSAFGLLKCNTPGAKSGEIAFSAEGGLAYASEVGEEVVADLKLPSEVTINCTASETLKIRGSVICPIGPLNTAMMDLTLSCKQTKGVQAPAEYEDGAGEHITDILETKGEGLKKFAFEQSGLSVAIELAFEEQVVVQKGGLPRQLTFFKVGEVAKLLKKKPPVKILKVTLAKVGGGVFEAKKTCVNMESPPCELEVKFNGPEEDSLSVLTVELESPVGSGRTRIEKVKLVR